MNSSTLIASMLVPGIFIISSAILLFSTNSKYSLIVNRIRTLKEEKAKLVSCEDKKTESRQLNVIELQLHHLIHRISLVRWSILCYAASMLFFIVSCILIGIRIQPSVDAYYYVQLSFVFSGFFAIIGGLVFSVIEMFKGYRIVRLEVGEISGQ